MTTKNIQSEMNAESARVAEFDKERAKEAIVYTITDEAPALATRSLLPIVSAFAKACGVDVITSDISLAARIVDAFADTVAPGRESALEQLGELAKSRQANIVKLPNISASVPQLVAAIAELQNAGIEVPDYVEEPATAAEREARAIYDTVKGSAVNPVLREGNSDRRAPSSVKKYVRANPHAMGAWSADSPSRVTTMSEGDFASNEESFCAAEATKIEVIFSPDTCAGDGSERLLCSVELEEGEIFDATYMSVAKLNEFYNQQVDIAAEEGLLFSLHLKATMMKVSDPIIFGHGVRSYFASIFEQYSEELASCDADPSNGLAAVLESVSTLDDAEAAEITSAFQTRLAQGAGLAMVNSDKGITNLHVPSDVIIDASMPAMIRTSAKMWNRDGKLQEALAVIPDSSYASLYSETFEHCKKYGAFNPATMGTVPNVGLMAGKAEEYGSHDKTFEIEADGVVRVVDSKGEIRLEQRVEKGDIWRGCQVKAAAITNWVELALKRAKATGWPCVFWLDETRSHDAQVLKQVRAHLHKCDTDGVEILIMDVAEAAKYTLERARAGADTISVTGNVLRDYLTDLFPILELGTSAKMLSVVPLMNGGGLFETGAGGSAPKHVQQFLAENHLRWDSLGEFLALTVAFEHFGEVHDNARALLLSEALEDATEMVLHKRRSPQRRVNEPDNRTSHFYLGKYWAQALAAQNRDEDLREIFAPLARQLSEAQDVIVAELMQVQGHKVDIGQYYAPDPLLADAAMRPSKTLNTILAQFEASTI